MPNNGSLDTKISEFFQCNTSRDIIRYFSAVASEDPVYTVGQIFIFIALENVYFKKSIRYMNIRVNQNSEQIKFAYIFNGKYYKLNEQH